MPWTIVSTMPPSFNTTWMPRATPIMSATLEQVLVICRPADAEVRVGVDDVGSLAVSCFIAWHICSELMIG